MIYYIKKLVIQSKVNLYTLERTMKVFSFTLFGSLDRYCKGMIINIKEIEKRFPDFYIWIYIANDVPQTYIDEFYRHPNVKLIFTDYKNDTAKMCRFLPIDDPDVELMIVRDADSRVYFRDETSVRDFMSSSKLFHIIRDHRVHTIPILGGLWGAKKGCFDFKIKDALEYFFQNITPKEKCEYEDDQNFLRKMIYPSVLDNALIQDEYHQGFEPPSMHTPISRPRIFPDFIGQIYMFDENGNEYTVCGP